MKKNTDLIIHNAAQLCVVPAQDGGPQRGGKLGTLGIIEDGALAIHEGVIVAVGGSAEILSTYEPGQVVDAQQGAVVPGFVDCHTHAVWAGDRAAEFEMRIAGATYMEIMAAGGGINNTVQAVRGAALEDMVASSLPRLDAMMALGTTTVEIKTGYGLDLDSELKLLEAAAVLDQQHAVTVIPTFLGAHAVPPEYKGRTEDYVQLVIAEMLPAASEWYARSHFAEQGTPFYVDVFCEEGVFDRGQSARVLEAGAALGMRVKAHIDEFKTLGGMSVALALGADSVDHLDVTPPEDIQALAHSGTVGVVIPAVNFNLGSTHFADARAIIDAGAAVALATDINPGSAPCPSMPLVMAIACRYQRLTPAEALAASTINAAFTVGSGEIAGSLEPGKQADLLVLAESDYRHLAYQFGGNLIKTVVKAGKIWNS